MERQVLSDYENYANKKFITEGFEYLQKWSDGAPRVYNADKVRIANKSPPYIYVCNHTSMLDYFIPSWVILNEGLPYPRSLVGSNLLNWFVKTFMWDFRKGGAISVPRGKRVVDDNGETKLTVEPSETKRYHRENIDSLKRGESLFVFPQGGRDSEQRKERNIFNSDYFRMPLMALDKFQAEEGIDDIHIVNVAAAHSVIPERNYWSKIDGNGFGSKSYFFWDMWAYYKHSRSSAKGISKVNFAEPVSLREISGKGSLKERAKKVGVFCESEINSLLGKIL